MKVKVIRQFLHPTERNRVVQEGETLDVTEGIARDLAKNNLVVPEPGSGMRAAAGRPAQAGAVDPTPSPPTGGPTGGARNASSWDQDQPRRQRRSRSREE